MHDAGLSHMTEPLREMLGDAGFFLRGYRERHGVKLAALVCDILPQEVLLAFGTLPLRVPVLGKPDACACGHASLEERLDGMETAYDCIIIPGNCPAGRTGIRDTLPVYNFCVPGGYGEEFAIQLHKALDDLLRAMGAGSIADIRADALREAAELYNTLRRLVRGIASMRAQKPRLLSQGDLFLIFEAAAALPPEMLIEHLSAILDALNAVEGHDSEEPRVKVLAAGGVLSDAGPLQEFERAGCLVVEDDFCNGRRQFDLSHNAPSPGLYYEILDAFSYRPFCPAQRNVEERFELFYKLLRIHGIDLVVFLEDTMCEHALKQMGLLRIRLMRAGIDPVVTATGRAFDDLRSYLEAVQ